MKTLQKCILGIGMFFIIVTPVFADTSQDVYQSSLQQLITLLQQEVAMLVAQLQQVTHMVSQPVLSNGNVSPSEVSTATVPECAGNPVLNITANSTSQSQETIKASYTTGCPLDPGIMWSYTNANETNTGTIGGNPNVWYVSTKDDGTTFTFSIVGQNKVNPFSITVGAVTQSLTPILACNVQVQQVQDQIMKLRQTASNQEAGELSSGTASIGQGNAQRIAQQELQDESPLQIQLQQLLSSSGCN